MASPSRTQRNRLATLDAADWRAALRRTGREIITDRVGLVAAGCAFYATLALFPAMSMVIAIYGLAFDPNTVTPQLAYLRNLLPPSAYALIGGWLQHLVSRQPSTHTLNLIISTTIALWSSSAGTRSLLGALKLAYDTREQRGFFAYQMVALALTLGNMIGAALCIAAIVLIPAVLSFLGVPHGAAAALRNGGLIIMMAFVYVSIGAFYRFGPGRPPESGQMSTPGALLATLLWLIASTAFSYYVGHLSSYGTTYGPLGAVVGLMMWFYVSAYVILLGAELNAALEAYTPGADGEGKQAQLLPHAIRRPAP
jgi:membrane protein